MVKVGDIGGGEFRLVSDENSDDLLNDLGAVAAADFNVSAEQFVGAGNANYVAFSIRNVKYGRTYDGKATGPDGESDAEDEVMIGYEYSGLPDEQSPPTKLEIEEYFLPAPEAQWLNLTLEGSIAVSGAGSGSQNVEVRVYDRDSLTADDRLDTSNFVLNHPPEAWDGVLIPYVTNIGLFIDGNGKVAGADGDSGESPAQVYQYLVRPGLTPNVESDAINIP